MEWRNMLLAQLGVLIRAAVVAAAGYGPWLFFSGSSVSPRLYAKIVVALWAAANAVFWLVKWYKPDVLYSAKYVEERL